MKSLLGKVIAFALAGTMVLATASCGGSGDSKTQTADSSTGSLEKVEMYTIPDPQISAAHVIVMGNDRTIRTCGFKTACCSS